MYRPEIGEVVIIDIAISNIDPFKARITALGDEDEVVAFERLDGVQMKNKICHISDVVWTENVSKQDALVQYQAELEAKAWET